MRTTIILTLLMICKSFVYAGSHHPEELLKEIKGKADEGQQIVAAYCANCHAQKPLINLGAPRIGITKDWEKRLEQSLERLFRNMDEGINAMPQRGGCFECSDKQLMLAVGAMLSNEQQKDFLVIVKDSKKYN